MAGRDRGRLTGEGDPSPIVVDGEAPAVLAIHGFGATPAEMSPVTDVAERLGLRAFAPLLPGHGTHARDLSKTRWPDWAAASEAALDDVSQDGPAIAVGLSLGSLLAIHLASKRPGDVRAVVLLANATRLTWPFPSAALRLVERLNVPDFFLPKGDGADIGDPEARRTHLTYGTQPVHAALSVQKAGDAMLEQLSNVRCPALVIHGKNDRVCPVSNARRVAEGLASVDKNVIVLPRSHHIITRDWERGVVEREIEKFVTRIARQRPVEP